PPAPDGGRDRRRLSRLPDALRRRRRGGVAERDAQPGVGRGLRARSGDALLARAAAAGRKAVPGRRAHGLVLGDDGRRRPLQAAALRARGTRFWLVTSDRELRARAGGSADRTIGGGTFARTLLDLRSDRAESDTAP